MSSSEESGSRDDTHLAAEEDDRQTNKHTMELHGINKRTVPSRFFGLMCGGQSELWRQRVGTGVGSRPACLPAAHCLTLDRRPWCPQGGDGQDTCVGFVHC